MYLDEEIEVLEALQIDWGDEAICSDRRSPQTVARYRYRAGCLMRRAGTAEVPGTIRDAIELLVVIAPTLRHSTCRQYRAALLQTLRDCHDAGAMGLAKAGDHLRRLGLLGAPPLRHGDRHLLPIRCGAGRSRGLLAGAHRETVLRLRASGTPMATTLSNILVVGDLVGLRPWEWPTAEVRDELLLIQSAKMSDRLGRGLVPVRELDLKPLGLVWIETIAAICGGLRKELERYGTPEKVMERYAKLLRACRLDPKMTLRSPRHQFRKNAQSAGWSSAKIAVAMNHGAAASQLAYGRGAKGRRGLTLPGIDRSLLAFVDRPGPMPK
ncbi:MAG TPA: hypothetical protein ENH55_02820 [Aurantimonas coralicida]|uniref:Tyr recombinase domain-containing protein n=2 Tax=root TaxID=1 RepID=A0A9C9NFY1_9HYPH|nr:hypothetical protein [Aurantimonas coralicida]HEU00520.1 hypothetical protein [Aurantimonas coralicida]